MLLIIWKTLQVPVAFVAPAFDAGMLTIAGAERSIGARAVQPMLLAMLQGNTLVTLTGHAANHPKDKGVHLMWRRCRSLPSSDFHFHGQHSFGFLSLDFLFAF